MSKRPQRFEQSSGWTSRPWGGSRKRKGPAQPGRTNISEGSRRMDYDPFGNAVIVEKFNTTALVNRIPAFGFSTKYQDRESGLYYYGYRYYDPYTGRWPSRDLIGEEGGVNLYGFVGNDGLNRVDYLGLEKAFDYSDSEFEAAKKAGHAGMRGAIEEFEQKLSEWEKRPENAGKRSPVIGPREYGGRICCRNGKFYSIEAKGPWPTGIFSGVRPHISPLEMPKCEGKDDKEVAFWHIHPPRWVEKRFSRDRPSYYSNAEDFSDPDRNMINNKTLNPNRLPIWVAIYRRSGEEDWITKRTSP